jgi:hypothetical protein
MSNMNDQFQKEASAAVAWFKHPVPLWAIGIAFLAGAVASHL